MRKTRSYLTRISNPKPEGKNGILYYNILFKQPLIIITMAWERFEDGKALLTMTRHGTTGIGRNYKHNPKGTPVEPIKLSPGGIFIATHADIKIFQRQLDIPYQIKNSQESGTLTHIQATIRDQKYLTEVRAIPKGNLDSFKIFTRDFGYEIKAGSCHYSGPLPLLTPTDRKLVPSSAQGVFCLEIKTALEDLTPIDRFDLEECLTHMKEKS